ncbi:AAA family ATPase [Natronosporangium hydrolyticum]|uniref:AAA family ATPase n=1 Tax=Natronosporangium hydrolyticum TaxID=2811111 RepID=A0A895YJ38_9ACTN|nr:LuxR family transcriptional regulator [Natronosporangium hydrolyticum]QSB16052.1 AAA family ATPase [Natronosporangium hydrolyticum]
MAEHADSAGDLAGRRVVSPAYVGRVAELTQLVAAVTMPPAVVVIEGEAGLGKTRLVQELAGRPELAHQRLLVGRCHPIRESFPLGPVVEALRGLGDALGPVALSPVTGALRPLLPELADQLPPQPDTLADQGIERHRVFRALTAVLDALAPVTLILEDLHAADEQTADFVGYLLAEPHPKLSVVLTYRPEDADPTVRALTTGRHTATSRTDVVLAPLDAAQTGILAAAILGVEQVSDEFAEYLCERSSGSPFAVEELLALLRTRGTLVRRGGGWARRALAELDVPSSIRESVLERVSRLSEPARAVVAAAAVLHRSVPVAVLTETCRVAPEQLLSALNEALDSALLAEPGEEIGFRHQLAAEAVYAELAGPVRADLHGRAAAALSALPPVPLGQVAHHLRHAGRLPEWVDAAEQAAVQALALGHDVAAARLLEEVLRHAPLPPDRAGRLAARLAQASIEALRTREVADLLSSVLARELSPSVRGELRFRLGLLLHELGDDPARERRLVADAVAELTDRPDLRAWAAVVLGIPTTEGVPLAEHRRWLQRAMEFLPAVADPVFEAFLLGKVAMVLAPMGDPGWRELIERVERRAADPPRHRSEVNAYWSVGTQAGYAGHHAVANRLLTAAMAGAVAGESPRLTLSIGSGLVLLDYCRGGWDGLVPRISTYTEQLAEYPRAVADAQVAAACLALARGDLDRASAALSAVVAQIEALGGFDLLPLPLAAWLRLAVARQQLPAAVAAVDRLLTAVAQKEVWAPAMRALPPATAALLAAGEPGRATELYEQAQAAVRELDAPLAPAALAHAWGLLAQARGEPAAGPSLLTAAGHYRAQECPYEAAQAMEAAAMVGYAGQSTAGGEFAASGEALLAALTQYRDLGAEWDVSRVARVARGHGLPVPTRHRGGRRGYGSQLSPRERQVAELAATGRSNKEIAAELFLSVHTVARHIAAAMRKLNIRSRAALGHRLVACELSSPTAGEEVGGAD